MKFVYAIMGLAAGVAMLKYAKQVYAFTGQFPWAEKWLGHGGTYTVIRLIGAAIVFVFLLYPFGYWDKYLQEGRDPGGTAAERTAPAASARP